MKIGDKFRRRIDEAIHVYERLLLILSEILGSRSFAPGPGITPRD
jgi:hypothetical protein